MPDTPRTPTQKRERRRQPGAAARTRLDYPVIGLEAEFNVWVDGKEIIPEKYWKHPSAFISHAMLTRTKKSSQLPTGGAVYFDRGVIEVVTPVIELAPGCTARAVRSLWEQLGFVRDQLSSWERRTGHHVRLKAYSTHYNISFELKRSEQNRYRNAKRLALLLSYLLPVPAMLVGANRRSTGIGVRPRGERIEITADFTPDPGLMIATTTLLVGIVREVMSWPDYRLSRLRTMPLPTIAGVIPGKHTTRKGWLTKDFHYPQSPFTCDINAPLWTTRHGETLSLREIGKRVAWHFRDSIRRYSDPFSFRLLFAILNGRAPSMLELSDRPLAYEDVGRLCRWGEVIHELRSYRSEQLISRVRRELWGEPTMDSFLAAREKERAAQRRVTQSKVSARPPRPRRAEAPKQMPAATPVVSLLSDAERAAAGGGELLEDPSARRPQPRVARRKSDPPGRSLPTRTTDYVERRGDNGNPPRGKERRRRERRKNSFAIPFPDRRLTRSAYELVFLKLVSGERLKVGRETYTPVGMKGWYHAIFRRDSDGREKTFTIDQLLKRMNDWR